MEKYDPDLDPCPFCGAKPFITKVVCFDDGYFVECPKCGIEQGYAYTYENAIEHWNTRKEVKR